MQTRTSPRSRGGCRARKLLVIAKERLDEHAQHKLVGLLRAGDREGQVAKAWHAKEAVRELYAHTDADLALEWVDDLSQSMDQARGSHPVTPRKSEEPGYPEWDVAGLPVESAPAHAE